jgi:hypothetical protein
VNDLERWIELEGPEPDDLTPERLERMKRRLYVAIAEDRRRSARRRTASRVLGGVLAAAGLAAAIGLAVHAASSSGLTLAVVQHLGSDAARALPNQHAAGVESAASPPSPLPSRTERKRPPMR